MVTQKDVAGKAGVSFITVSRVINGEHNVKETTRIKVQKVIDELGYCPGFAGKALNSGKCNIIAVLTPIPFDEDMRMFYLMRVLSGIEKSCREHRTDILLGLSAEKQKEYDYLRPYRQRKVDGIIYIGLKEFPDILLKELTMRKLPCVIIGDRPQHKAVSWVDTDNYTAGYNTVREIWKRGHRFIAFLGIPSSLYNANITDRENGFRQALRTLGSAENPDEYIIRADYEPAHIKRLIAEALKKMAPLPTALFCSTDSAVPAAVEAIEAAGLRVPEDVSVVGFDGFINKMYYKLNIATNLQPLPEMGYRAAEILFEHIENYGTPSVREILQVPFMTGASLAAPNLPTGRK
jgi:LacI family transcriptional regulator